MNEAQIAQQLQYLRDKADNRYINAAPSPEEIAEYEEALDFFHDDVRQYLDEVIAEYMRNTFKFEHLSDEAFRELKQDVKRMIYKKLKEEFEND